MMLRDMHRIVVLALAAGILPSPGIAQSTEYKDFETTSSRLVLFEIRADRKTISFEATVDGQSVITDAPRSDISVSGNRIEVGGEVLFDNDGLWLNKRLIPYEDITDLSVKESDDETAVTVYTRSASDRQTSRVRRGNIIEPFKPIVVEKDEFLRGTVFSVAGNIEIYGEVNHDVVSLFGDVYVGPDAVIRGDVVTLKGRADVARDASVYGSVLSGPDGDRSKKHRFHRRENEVTAWGRLGYNRVDGAAPHGGIRYDDSDSLLPRMWAEGGYAFGSERWRYELGLEQTVLRSIPLMIGGALYRQLASEDTAIITREENTAYALLMTEDFMDYYEAEGGRVYVKVKPVSELTLEGGYRYEDTRWFPARNNLWSLFGGDKRFADNFGSVNLIYRDQGIAEIDTTTNVALFANVTWDTRDKETPLEYSGWVASGAFEWSHPDISSDFDYRRYKAELTRLQRLNRRIMLIVRGTYGASDGYLPMYKRFYLGGIGTLHGYRHKEYMGTRFWMVNTEYRLEFPRTDLALALSWDVGQISNTSKFGSDDDVRHSLGLSLYVGDDFKMTVAKRLDRSYDNDPKLYVRFMHAI
jgi:hypothetical protein